MSIFFSDIILTKASPLLCADLQLKELNLNSFGALGGGGLEVAASQLLTSVPPLEILPSRQERVRALLGGACYVIFLAARFGCS